MKHFFLAFFTVLLFTSGCCIGEYEGEFESKNDDLSGKVLDSNGLPFSNVEVSIFFSSNLSSYNSNKTISSTNGDFLLKNGFPYTQSYDFKSFPDCGEKANVNNRMNPFLLLFKTNSNDSNIVGFFNDSLEIKLEYYKQWVSNSDTIILKEISALGEFGKEHKIPNIILR